MLKRALPIVVLLASATSSAAPPAPPTGSSATVTPVPNIAFGQSLLSDPPVSAAKTVIAPNAQGAPAPPVKPAAVAKASKASASATLAPGAASEEEAVQAAEPAKTVEASEGGRWWSEKTVNDVLTLVFTGLLALFTFRLWKSTNALWEETKSAGATAKTAADAAEASANSAKTSAAATLLSVEASIAAQQPRWFVKDMHLLSISDHPKSTISRSVAVTLINHGSSAAEVLRTEMSYCLAVTAPGGIKRRPDLCHASAMNLNKTNQEFGRVTKSGETFRFIQPTAFDEGTLTGLETGSMEYFIMGKVQYRDYLNRIWEHSFVGVLDPQRMNVRNPQNTGQALESPFIQPVPGSSTDPFTYTRRLDVTDQPEA